MKIPGHWIDMVAEHHRSKKRNWLKDIPAAGHSKAPIVVLGYSEYKDGGI
jgi:hypothetical protein